MSNMPESIWADRSNDGLPQYKDTPFGIWWHDARDGYTQYVRADAAEAREAKLREALERCPPEKPTDKNRDFANRVATWWRLWARPALDQSRAVGVMERRGR